MDARSLNKEVMSESHLQLGKSAKRNKGRNGNIKPQNQHNNGSTQAMRITKKYEYLVHLGLFDSSESFHVKDKLVKQCDKSNASQEVLTSSPCTLVAVEVKPQNFESQLPPSVRQKKFGAM